MVKECLVIPTKVLEEEKIIPVERANQALYIPLSSVGGAEKIYHLARLYGEYRKRGGDRNVEDDPAFQQFIMYAFVTKGNKFLAYQRGSAEEGKYDESRLAGKVSLGLGGHIERSDLSLENALYREIDEESKLLINGETEIDFRFGTGVANIKYMRNFINFKPIALIKDEQNEVGKFHLGIACKLTPKYPSTTIAVRTDGENVRYSYLTLTEYKSLKGSGEIVPEGWSDIVYQNELLNNPSLLNPPTYKPRRLY